MRALAIAVSCCAIAVPALAASDSPKIALSKPLPSLVRVGQRVTVKGRVLRPPARGRAALQVLRTGPWTTAAQARIGAHGAFTIRWHVSTSDLGPLSLRVAALEHGRPVASTEAKSSGVGPKAVSCAPPVPPAVNIPVGDGWIVGGLYLEGGPFPGIDECEQQPYAINAETSSGTVVASQNVAGGHSYTLVIPAGGYKLHANTGCFGSASVTAGKQTTANTYCLLP